MIKLDYLNLGCGSKYREDWINIDLVSDSPFVISHDILTGLPFEDGKFDVVYHSQVLEHIPKEKAIDCIKECFRILKPNGIIRIVVPDLENIVDEYKKQLIENLRDPTPESMAEYDWSMLELLDQSTRNYSGGQMAEFLKRPIIFKEEYIFERIGTIGRNIIEQSKRQIISAYDKSTPSQARRLIRLVKRTLLHFKLDSLKFRQRVLKVILSRKEFEYLKLGEFRRSGEIHFWMYDRFSLKMLLERCGFRDITIKSPYESMISNWASFELDVKNGSVCDPNSLYMEAIR